MCTMALRIGPIVGRSLLQEAGLMLGRYSWLPGASNGPADRGEDDAFNPHSDLINSSDQGASPYTDHRWLARGGKQAAALARASSQKRREGCKVSGSPHD